MGPFYHWRPKVIACINTYSSILQNKTTTTTTKTIFKQIYRPTTNNKTLVSVWILFPQLAFGLFYTLLVGFLVIVCIFWLFDFCCSVLWYFLPFDLGPAHIKPSHTVIILFLATIILLFMDLTFNVLLFSFSFFLILLTKKQLSYII